MTERKKERNQLNTAARDTFAESLISTHHVLRERFGRHAMTHRFPWQREDKRNPRCQFPVRVLFPAEEGNGPGTNYSKS